MEKYPIGQSLTIVLTCNTLARICHNIKKPDLNSQLICRALRTDLHTADLLGGEDENKDRDRTFEKIV